MHSDCPDLSVVVLTRDVAEVLEGALASVPPGAEIVVADGGSRDGTRAIARRSGARVIDQDLAAVAAAGGNFDLARNDAAEKARRPWVFFLDADERLSAPLARELAELLAGEPAASAYEVPRRNLFWGRPVRLLGDDYQVRLVRRGAGRFEGRSLHARMQVDGAIGRLASPLIHLNVRSWRDVVRRFRRDVPIAAGALEERPPVGRALREPFHMFRLHYCSHQAWRDGPRGLLVSVVYAAYHGAILWTRRRRRHA